VCYRLSLVVHSIHVSIYTLHLVLARLRNQYMPLRGVVGTGGDML
jgi:hypothetical protein